MTTVGFAGLVAALRRTTDDGDAAPGASVDEVLAAAGMASDAPIPSYFHDGLRTLIARETLPWIELPAAEAGRSELLRTVGELVPGSWYRRYPTVDVLAVPALGRALVVHRADGGAPERYGVADLGDHGRRLDPPEGSAKRVWRTLTPTDDQLRRWAYDPGITLGNEEQLALEGAAPGMLVELARDPDGPRRQRLRGVILSQGLWHVLARGGAALPEMRQLAERLERSGDPELRGDGDVVRWWVGYLEGQGPVDRELAARVGHVALAGVAPVEVAVSEVDGWWTVTVPSRAAGDVVYVHRATGALRHVRGGALDLAALAAVGTPASRVALLGDQRTR